MNSGIYKITNTLNNKMYIGSAKDFDVRFSRHIRDLKNNAHHNIHLQRSYNKYGFDVFEFEIIERIPYEKDIIIERENYYIKEFNSKTEGYNIADASFGDILSSHPNREDIVSRISKTLRENISKLSAEERKLKYGMPGESNGMYGKTHTQDVRDKIGRIHKGNTYRKGIKASKETREKLSVIASQRIGDKNPFYGKTHSEESRKKMSENNMGKIPPNRISITIDGVHYESYGHASKALGIPVTTIRWRCLSKNIKFNNYVINAERLSKPN